MNRPQLRSNELLSKLMKERGLSNGALADYCHCSRATIGHLRSGQRDKADPDVARRIAIALEVEPDELFSGTSTLSTSGEEGEAPAPRRKGVSATPLGDFLYDNLPASMSMRQVAARARKLGHDVSDGTVQAIFSGRSLTPTETSLRAIADALNLSPSELAEKAAVQLGSGRQYTPPEGSDRLTARQRRAVDTMILAMINPGDL